MDTHNILKIIFLSILLISALELVLHLLIKHLRKNFQWLITAEDRQPIFPAAVLKKYFSHGFDPELGWVRKANTYAEESSNTVGEATGALKKSAYHINPRGARLNSGHEKLPLKISTYGDSFVFSRQVNDDKTWQWYLSELTQTNVQNFGVGNYGIDQSLLRLKREYKQNQTPIVIIGVVPETIVRILCVWKHYSEYGNILAFKPRFKITNGHLDAIRNPIDNERKFLKVHQYLDEINDQDYFYDNKFKKDILCFPYLVSLSRSSRRNVPLIQALLKDQLLSLTRKKIETRRDRPWEMVLDRNFKIVRGLYQNKDATELFLGILENLTGFAKQNEFYPVFLLMPYLHDILNIKEHGGYYDTFVSQAEKIITTIDLTHALMNSDCLQELYSSDFYGGHLSEKGNQFVSKILYEKLFGLYPMIFKGSENLVAN